MRIVRPHSVVLTVLAAVLLGAGCAATPTTSWQPGPTSAPAASGSAAPTTPGSSPSASPVAASSGGSGTSDTTFNLVGSKPCPESRFECVTLSVLRDHFGAAAGATWDVTFAIQRAAKERIGTFVVITGGPGSSGIAVADGYTDYYDTSITDVYDIVFVDQRGIGLSEPIQCIDAAATYYRSSDDVMDPAQRPAAAATARTFVTNCIAEARIDPADLPLYGTVQAVEDLESIRRFLDVETLHLYGESYGTQFVQYYAAVYPSHIATLYLDGPVDLTIDGPTYYVEAARSAEDTLTETLDACADDETCAGDVAGGDLLAAYDTLATRMARGPQTFDWTTADGATVQRQLTIADLQNAAFGYIYSPGDRFLLQRAIAAASHGNLVPLARLSYGSIGIDPETLEAIEDPSWSDALYFAVECQDYAFFPTAGDPDARLAAWVDHATAANIGDLRMGVSYFGDVPCLYWPDARPTDARPGPIVDPPYPVFVLTSTTDPATPIANGMRIYSRLDDAYFFQALGGPHVIFAWGEPCPDEIVYAYMADGTLPPSRVTSCVWDIADPYVGIAPTTAAEYDGPLALAASIDDQILSTDDYLSRLDDAALVIGCDFGGTLTYTPSDVGTEVVLDACEFTDGLALSGDGATDDEAGTFELDLERGTDALHYERDADGGRSVSGTYEGRRVEIEEAA